MPVLKKKKEPIPKSDIDQIKESAEDKNVETDQIFKPNEGNFGLVISTGSTLLDLAISGSKVKGGGIPGGVLVEIAGESQTGKTAILSELCGSTQIRGGEVKSVDPEGRLDQEYVQIYGVRIQEDIFDYSRPDTVEEVFELINTWKPKNPNVLNLFAADSLAALSTTMEMDGEDKMGMKRAKDFSAGLRKTCRMIANNNWVIACTNQLRQDTTGHKVTPGGMGIPFYASIRIKMVPEFKGHKIEKEIELKSGVKVKKVIGVRTVCTVTKSVDDPFRTAPISIIFGLGVDDIRANLQYYKDMTKETKYNAITKEIGTMDNAIRHIETEGLEKNLRESVITLWEEIQEQFAQNRKRKVRI